MSKYKENIKIDEIQKLKEPSYYNVVLFNDDYTTMDFVVELLINVFNKNAMDAIILMYNIHNDGKAVAGIYTYDIAATKRKEALAASKRKNFPLKIELEEN